MTVRRRHEELMKFTRAGTETASAYLTDALRAQRKRRRLSKRVINEL